MNKAAPPLSTRAARYRIHRVSAGTREDHDFIQVPHLVYPDQREYGQKATRPALHLNPERYLMMRGKYPVGRFALYRNEGLRYRGQTAVLLGSYECINDPGAHEALLGFAVRSARQRSADWLIGPVEGSIWERYRFRTTDTNPLFLLEPGQDPSYPGYWEKYGFHPIMDYLTNVDETLSYDDGQLDRMWRRYVDRGAVIRPFDKSRAEEELVRLARLSNIAFAGSFLFTPITVEDFVSKYKRILPMMDARFVWLVEGQDKRLEAFLFAIPDLYDREGRTLLIKSMAVRPDSSYRGIATWLARHLNRVATSAGYARILHALMRRDNLSVNASLRYTKQCYAEYSLYGMKL